MAVFSKPEFVNLLKNVNPYFFAKRDFKDLTDESSFQDAEYQKFNAWSNDKKTQLILDSKSVLKINSITYRCTKIKLFLKFMEDNYDIYEKAYRYQHYNPYVNNIDNIMTAEEIGGMFNNNEYSDFKFVSYRGQRYEQLEFTGKKSFKNSKFYKDIAFFAHVTDGYNIQSIINQGFKTTSRLERNAINFKGIDDETPISERKFGQYDGVYFVAVFNKWISSYESFMKVINNDSKNQHVVFVSKDIILDPTIEFHFNYYDDLGKISSAEQRQGPTINPFLDSTYNKYVKPKINTLGVDLLTNEMVFHNDHLQKKYIIGHLNLDHKELTSINPNKSLTKLKQIL